MFKLKKSLGQNFLTDKNIINKIISIETLKNQNVMEIGPGSGNLTKLIIQKGIKKFLENNPDVIEDCTKLTEQSFSQYLALADIPEPDLFIRTGGEQRLSNFLLWNLAYTELYFTDILWPDFDKGDLKEAINFYIGRKRRFGGTVDFRVRASEDENNDQLSNIL